MFIPVALANDLNCLVKLSVCVAKLILFNCSIVLFSYIPVRYLNTLPIFSEKKQTLSIQEFNNMNPINTYYKQGQLNSNVKEYLKKFTIYSEKLLFE